MLQHLPLLQNQDMMLKVVKSEVVVISDFKKYPTIVGVGGIVEIGEDRVITETDKITEDIEIRVIFETVTMIDIVVVMPKGKEIEGGIELVVKIEAK
jgi:hypothetical protein